MTQAPEMGGDGGVGGGGGGVGDRRKCGGHIVG